MATVKFSGELRDQIVNAAAHKFQGAVNAAQQDSPKDWGDRLYDLMFFQHRDTMLSLPKHFFPYRQTFAIERVGDQPCNLQYTLTKPMPFPHDFPQMGPITKRSYHDTLILEQAVAPDFYNEVVAWRKRVQAAVDRQTEFKSSVKQVINAYATLAPALKAWPPLWDLIPEATKEKHKEIKEREKKDVELNVDLDRMTALASFSKIRGSDQ